MALRGRRACGASMSGQQRAVLKHRLWAAIISTAWAVTVAAAWVHCTEPDAQWGQHVGLPPGRLSSEHVQAARPTAAGLLGAAVCRS